MAFLLRFLRILAAPVQSLFRLPLGLFAIAVARWGLATRLAILFTVVLLTTYVVTGFVYFLMEGETWTVWARSTWLAVVLIPLISYLIYAAVRAFLYHGDADYPDLRRTWQEIVNSLEASGRSIHTTPVFLVLGCGGRSDVLRLMSDVATQHKFEESVSGASSDTTLYCFGNQDAIYLVPAYPTAACSLLSSPLSKIRSQDANNTLGDSTTIQSRQSTMPTTARQDAKGRSEIESTASPRMSSGSLGVNVKSFGARQKREATHRLTFLCRLLRSERAGVIPLNGILLTFDINHIGLHQESFAEAVTEDLEAVQDACEANVATIFLARGAEKHPGFRSLARGIAGSGDLRLGASIDIPLIPPTEDNMDKLCQKMLIAVENVVFSRMELSAPAINRDMYQFVCFMRLNVLTAIRRLMTSLSRSGSVPFLVSGLYIAGDGEADDTAFVKGVFAKLRAHEDDCEWLPSLVQREQKLALIFNGLLVVNGLLLMASLCFLFLYLF